MLMLGKASWQAILFGGVVLVGIAVYQWAHDGGGRAVLFAAVGLGLIVRALMVRGSRKADDDEQSRRF